LTVKLMVSLTSAGIGILARWQRAGYPRWTLPLLAPLALIMLIAWVIAIGARRAKLFVLRPCRPILNSALVRRIVAIASVKLPGFSGPTGQEAAAEVLLTRLTWCRPLLTPCVLVEWLALVGFGASVGLLAIGGPRVLIAVAFICATITLIVAAVGTPLCFIYQQSIKRWQSIPYRLCARCGYILDFSPSSHCSECGAVTVPAQDRRLPVACERWSPILNHSAVTAPYAAIGTAWFGSALLANWIPVPALGVVCLALTLSLTTLGLLAIRAVHRYRQCP